MLRNEAAYKYKATNKGPYQIIQMWTNVMVTTQMGSTIERLKIHFINPHKLKNMAENVTFIFYVYTSEITHLHIHTLEKLYIKTNVSIVFNDVVNVF